jgi:hypothetical protein
MKRLRNFHRTQIGIILLSFVGFILTVLLLLFTPWGNRVSEPLLEKSLSSALNTPIHVEEFSLTYKRFHLLFQDGYGNTLSTQGGFSLLTLRMYAHYRIECFAPEGFNPLATPLKTEGSLSGGIASFNIHGTSAVFGGDVLYKIELHRFHLSTLDLKVTKIAYEPLMKLLKYPSNTDTTITGDIALRGFDRRDIEGNIHLYSQTHRLTSTPFSEDSNETVTLKSLLEDKYGHVKPFNINVRLDASLEHAGILEPFVGIPLAGAINANGSIKGDDKLLRLHASSDVAQSDTTFNLIIPKLEPSSIHFDLKHADAEQTFKLFALLSPITGKLSAYADLNTTGGKLQISILEGSTIPSVLKQHYQITQPFIRFNADVTADLSKKGVHYRAAFKSNITRLEIDNTTTHEQMLRELLHSLP